MIAYHQNQLTSRSHYLLHFQQRHLTATPLITGAHSDSLPPSKRCAECLRSKNEQGFKNEQALPQPPVQWERKNYKYVR